MISQSSNSNELATKSFYTQELQDLENRVVTLEQWENSIKGVFNSLGKIDTDTIKTTDLNASSIISTMLNTQSLITGTLQASDLKPAFKLVHSNITYNPGSYYTLAYSTKPVNPGIVFVKVMGGNNDDYSLAIVQYTELSVAVLFSDTPNLLASFQVHNSGDYLYLTVAGNDTIANKQIMCSYINSEWVDIGVHPAVLGSDSIVLNSITETIGLDGFGTSNLIIKEITATDMTVENLTAVNITAKNTETDQLISNNSFTKDLTADIITVSDLTATDIISDTVDSLSVTAQDFHANNSVLNNVNINTGTISNEPINGIDIANKEYVDFTVQTETTRATTAETALSNKIDADVGAETARAIAREDALDAAKIDKAATGTKREIVTDLTEDGTEVSTIKLNKSSGNVDNNTSINTALSLRVASETAAGVMPKESFAQIINNTERIMSLENDIRVYLVTMPNDTPTQQELTDMYHTVSGKTGDPLDQTMLVDKAFEKNYIWFRSSGTWESMSLSQVNQFTNNSYGVIMGEDADGKVFAEANGTGSVVGWNALKDRVSNNETDNINSGTSLRKTVTATDNKIDLLSRNNSLLSSITVNSGNEVDAGLINAEFYDQLRRHTGTYVDRSQTNSRSYITTGTDLNLYTNQKSIIENYFCPSSPICDTLLNKPSALSQPFIMTCMEAQGQNLNGATIGLKQTIYPNYTGSGGVANLKHSNRIWQRNGTRQNGVVTWETWKILAENQSYNDIFFRQNPINFALGGISTNTRVKIILPSLVTTDNTIISFRIRLMNSNQVNNPKGAYELLVKGYFYATTGVWESVTVDQMAGSESITLYFGKETDTAYLDKAYISIDSPTGTNFSYLQLSVLDAIFYYRNQYKINDEWYIRFDTNIPNIQETVTTSPHLKMSDASVTPNANKLILRDNSGRAQISDPTTNFEIANKQYVDTITNSGLLITRGRLPAGDVSTAEYWNGLRTGIYIVDDTIGIPINPPAYGQANIVFVRATATELGTDNGSEKVIIWTKSSNGNVWIGTVDTNTWRGWKQVAFTGNVPVIGGAPGNVPQISDATTGITVSSDDSPVVWKGGQGKISVLNGNVTNIANTDTARLLALGRYQSIQYPIYAMVAGDKLSKIYDLNNIATPPRMLQIQLQSTNLEDKRTAGLPLLVDSQRYFIINIGSTNPVQSETAQLCIVEDGTSGASSSGGVGSSGIFYRRIQSVADFDNSDLWRQSLCSQDATPNLTVNRLVLRDNNGRAAVADPTNVAHIATKGYVDNTVATKQNQLSRTVVGNDNATAAVTDTGGNLSIPQPVTITAPVASTTQATAGTKTLRSLAQTIVNNIASLFSTKQNNLNRTITISDNSIANVTDTGANITAGVGVIVTAPTPNNSQETAGTKTLRDVTQTFMNNIAYLFNNKQNSLNRTVTGNDNATGTVSDTGGNLSIPQPVTVVAPAASTTQITAGTRTLRATLKILIDNIASLFTHTTSVSVHSATSAATASRIIIRDSAARAKVADPAAATDIATKGYVDTADTSTNTTLQAHINNTLDAHGAFYDARPSTIIARDPFGRAEINDPTAPLSIVNKQYADGILDKAEDMVDMLDNTVNQHIASTNAHSASIAPTANRIILRDANGRAQVNDPAAAADIATKNYIDNIIIESGNVTRRYVHNIILECTTDPKTNYVGRYRISFSLYLQSSTRLTTFLDVAAALSNYIDLDDSIVFATAGGSGWKNNLDPTNFMTFISDVSSIYDPNIAGGQGIYVQSYSNVSGILLPSTKMQDTVLPL